MADRGRYAPSPTGELHLGNASTALLAWLSIRASGGTFVMRVEDLDAGRVREGLLEAILADLEWLGIDWDEHHVQSERLASYRGAFDSLRERGLVYPCFCSRKDIAAAASAPQTPGEELRYPGTCLDLDPAGSQRRIEAGDRHAWRLRVAADGARGFDDLVHGPWGADQPPPGDFVVWRSDEVPAYQLAVVVDDAAMQIDEVVRGDDLLNSTVKQILLFEALGHRVPRFGHVPLLLGTDGVRLSKRHRGTTLRELRERGLGAAAIVGLLAQIVGLRETAEPVEAAALIDAFAWSKIKKSPGGTIVDPATIRG
jgi:glutamyl-tRNA synthetase